MTDRDKLIELLEKLFEFHIDDPYCIPDEADFADDLLANGVILPPCKVEDRYVMDTAKTIFNAWNDVTGALVEGTSWYYELESVIEDIVKLSFGAGVLYKEEAEEKLKELENNAQ